MDQTVSFAVAVLMVWGWRVALLLPAVVLIFEPWPVPEPDDVGGWRTGRLLILGVGSGLSAIAVFHVIRSTLRWG